MDLFTYGSLMFPAVWERVTGLTGPGIPARLADYAARRVQGRPYPALVPAAGETTRGRLYQNLAPDIMVQLDTFEGEFYERVEVILHLAHSMTTVAWVYRASQPSGPEILPDTWDAKHFAREDLPAFLREDPGFSGRRR